MAILKAGTTVAGSTVLTEGTHNNTSDPHDQYKLKSDLVLEYYTSATVDTLLAANSVADTAASAASAAAAALSETNAAASATSAASSASAASTSATNANTSAVASAASEAAAAISETNAATSATSASTSATGAALSETNAATSASAAATSAASAATSYDAFDDRYLGDKAVDPTLDNDGSALLVGALYFNTDLSVMRVFDGADWITVTTITPSVETKTLVSGQTVVTFTNGTEFGTFFLQGTDVDSRRLQLISDYTANHATKTITLTESYPAGTSIDLIFDPTLQSTYNDPTASNVGYTPAGTGAVGVSVESKLRESVSIKDFGAVGDSVTDDTAAIQAAIDYVESIGGGVIDFGIGTFKVTSTLIVDDNNVLLKGHGKGYITNSKTITRSTIATRLLWGGVAGGVLLRFTSNRNNDGTLPRKHGGGVSKIGLDGNEIAGKCFELQSWNEGYFDFLTCYATNIHWHLDVLSNGTNPSPSDSQGNTFDITSHDVVTTSEANTLGVIHGNTTANTSLNYFKYLNLTAESSAVALELGGCDGNFFDFIRCGTRATAIGNGGKIILHADDTMTTVPSTGDHSRYNNINFVQASKGIVSKATIAGTDSASDNSIEVLSGGNGSPFPSIEAGSTLIVNNYKGTNRASVSDGSASYTVHRPNAVLNNNIGNIRYDSEDDSGANLSYTRLACRVVDPTNGSEDGQWEVYTRQAGAETRAFYIWKGATVGSPTGTDKGLGTINAENGYYNDGIPWRTGTGSPEGVLAAPIGSLYTRTDGGASTTLYVKESGIGNTGWIAK